MGSGDDESRPSGADTTNDESTAAAPDDESGPLPSLGRREFALLGGVVALLLAAVALGMGPGGGVTDAEGPPATTPAPTASSAGAGGNATADDAPAITMQVRSIDSCGSRCREVTVALTNEGDAAARDVRAETELTTDGSLVWEGQSEIGRLPAGETVTRTRTIEVGYVDAARIKANDGVVRIETTVRTASGTRTFTDRRDVA